jgi:hypothetical protein
MCPIKLNAILYIIAEILLTVALIPLKLANMSYVIPDTLLKVSFNTNKTGHHVIQNVSYTVNNISAMMYNMAFNFIGV